MRWILAIGALALQVFAAPHHPEGKLDNWLYSSELGDETIKMLNRSELVGIQVLYHWRLLESEKGKYDFSSIRNDLDRVRDIRKKLWVQLQDRSFYMNNFPTPKYMSRPLYSNGSVPACDGTDCDTVFEQGGWTAAQWNPNVRKRYQALLKALAKDLDGDIYGINLPETSIEIDREANGFTTERYFNGVLENARYAAKVFKHSYVVQYVNFWPGSPQDSDGYFTKCFKFFAEHGVGVGGPDLKPWQERQVNNAYPFIYRYRNKVPISVIAYQEPDINYLNPNTSGPFTKEQLVDYAAKDLGVSQIFWATASPWLNE